MVDISKYTNNLPETTLGRIFGSHQNLQSAPLLSPLSNEVQLLPGADQYGPIDPYKGTPRLQGGVPIKPRWVIAAGVGVLAAFTLSHLYLNNPDSTYSNGKPKPSTTQAQKNTFTNPSNNTPVVVGDTAYLNPVQENTSPTLYSNNDLTSRTIQADRETFETLERIINADSDGKTTAAVDLAGQPTDTQATSLPASNTHLLNRDDQASTYTAPAVTAAVEDKQSTSPLLIRTFYSALRTLQTETQKFKPYKQELLHEDDNQFSNTIPRVPYHDSDPAQSGWKENNGRELAQTEVFLQRAGLSALNLVYNTNATEDGPNLYRRAKSRMGSPFRLVFDLIEAPVDFIFQKPWKKEAWGAARQDLADALDNLQDTCVDDLGGAVGNTVFAAGNIITGNIPATVTGFHKGIDHGRERHISDNLESMLRYLRRVTPVIGPAHTRTHFSSLDGEIVTQWPKVAKLSEYVFHILSNLPVLEPLSKQGKPDADDSPFNIETIGSLLSTLFLYEKLTDDGQSGKDQDSQGGSTVRGGRDPRTGGDAFGGTIIRD